jgi:hypothetical protein
MSRKPIGEKVMTAAERQRRRRAKMKEQQAEGSSNKSGRRRLSYLDAKPPENWTQELRSEVLAELGGIKQESVRRGDAACRYKSFGEQALGIEPRCKGYSRENSDRYRPLSRKKGILEQIGRQAIFVLMQGGTVEEAEAEAREWADDLLKDGDKLNVKEAIAFFQWLRKDMRKANGA